MGFDNQSPQQNANANSGAANGMNMNMSPLPNNNSGRQIIQQGQGSPNQWRYQLELNTSQNMPQHQQSGMQMSPKQWSIQSLRQSIGGVPDLQWNQENLMLQEQMKHMQLNSSNQQIFAQPQPWAQTQLQMQQWPQLQRNNSGGLGLSMNNNINNNQQGNWLSWKQWQFYSKKSISNAALQATTSTTSPTATNSNKKGSKRKSMISQSSSKRASKVKRNSLQSPANYTQQQWLRLSTSSRITGTWTNANGNGSYISMNDVENSNTNLGLNINQWNLNHNQNGGPSPVIIHDRNSWESQQRRPSMFDKLGAAFDLTINKKRSSQFTAEELRDTSKCYLTCRERIKIHPTCQKWRNLMVLGCFGYIFLCWFLMTALYLSRKNILIIVFNTMQGCGVYRMYLFAFLASEWKQFIPGFDRWGHRLNQNNEPVDDLGRRIYINEQNGDVIGHMEGNRFRTAPNLNADDKIYDSNGREIWGYTELGQPIYPTTQADFDEARSPQNGFLSPSPSQNANTIGLQHSMNSLSQRTSNSSFRDLDMVVVNEVIQSQQNQQGMQDQNQNLLAAQHQQQAAQLQVQQNGPTIDIPNIRDSRSDNSMSTPSIPTANIQFADDNNICPVCLDHGRNVACVPCGHLLCDACAKSMCPTFPRVPLNKGHACAVCRRIVTQYVRVFI